jgi:hypothetical protein
VEYAYNNPTTRTNNSMKLLMPQVPPQKYKYIDKEKYNIPPINKENFNDRIRIDSISRVRIHQQDHNIPPESKTYILQNMTKL